MMTDDTMALPCGTGLSSAARIEPASPSRPEASIPSAGRPKCYDPDILKVAAAEIAAACVEWDNGQSEPSEWIDDLVRCWFHWGDGYKLAKELEDRCGVDADMALAQALDSASHHLYTAHAAAIRKWVSEQGIQPTLGVGARVQTSRGEGAIGGIDLDRAIYLVVPDGQAERFGNGGGMCIDYEDASAIEARRAEPVPAGGDAK